MNQYVKVLMGLTSLCLLASSLAQAKTTPKAPHKTAVAIFAGGCFWCMEPPFDRLTGVLSTTSGYIGGNTPNPTYADVSAGASGHVEAVKIEFDPAKIQYPQLLKVFWRNIDPTRENAQFCDKGSQYRSEIFYVTEAQKKWAEGSRQALEQNKPFAEPIVTQITAATTFYAAEDYHQDFYQKSPIRYKFYRKVCGRDSRLETLWGSQ